MKKKVKQSFYAGLCLIAAFVLWTAAICFIDVEAIGPQNSAVGFAAFNGFVHDLTDVNMTLYTVTDWLGLVPVAFGFGFAVLGLTQWIKRKSLLKVDRSLLILGGFYIAVAAVYLLFEEVVINRRPVLIDGILEASYPSSTTVLVLCIMPTALIQLKEHIKNKRAKLIVNITIIIFITFMVVGRLVSGVHWVTDIIGGILLSAGLVALYYSINLSALSFAVSRQK